MSTSSEFNGHIHTQIVKHPHPHPPITYWYSQMQELWNPYHVNKKSLYSNSFGIQKPKMQIFNGMKMENRGWFSLYESVCFSGPGIGPTTTSCNTKLQYTKAQDTYYLEIHNPLIYWGITVQSQLLYHLTGSFYCHRWKRYHQMFPFWALQSQEYCALCERLHTDSTTKTYDMHKWYVEEAHCKSKNSPDIYNFINKASRLNLPNITLWFIIQLSFSISRVIWEQ